MVSYQLCSPYVDVIKEPWSAYGIFVTIVGTPSEPLLVCPVHFAPLLPSSAFCSQPLPCTTSRPCVLHRGNGDIDVEMSFVFRHF